MTSTKKTLIASVVAFSLGVLTTLIYHPVTAMPAEREQDLTWELADGVLHMYPSSPDKSLIAFASGADSSELILALPAGRESSLPVSVLEELIVAEVKPVAKMRDEVLLPCETSVCTAPPPPGVTGQVKMYTLKKCVEGAACAGQWPECTTHGQCGRS